MSRLGQEKMRTRTLEQVLAQIKSDFETAMGRVVGLGEEE